MRLEDGYREGYVGDLNQLDFALENRDLISEPILEIGSKDYGNTPDIRRHFPGARYLGVDQSAGPGVDVVCDLTAEFGSVRERIGMDHLGAVICFSVLEHCRDPFRMATNIMRLLDHGGTLLLSVPFVWNIHAFPDDYWRFTPSALAVLFPDLQLIPERSYYATKQRGERLALDSDLRAMGQVGRRGLDRVLRKLGIPRVRHPYMLFPVNINAVLVKPKNDAAVAFSGEP